MTLREENMTRLNALQAQGININLPAFYHELMLETIVEALYPDPDIDKLEELRQLHEERVSELLDNVEAQVRQTRLTQGIRIAPAQPPPN